VLLRTNNHEIVGEFVDSMRFNPNDTPHGSSDFIETMSRQAMGRVTELLAQHGVEEIVLNFKDMGLRGTSPDEGFNPVVFAERDKDHIETFVLNIYHASQKKRVAAYLIKDDGRASLAAWEIMRGREGYKSVWAVRFRVSSGGVVKPEDDEQVTFILHDEYGSRDRYLRFLVSFHKLIRRIVASPNRNGRFRYIGSVIPNDSRVVSGIEQRQLGIESAWYLTDTNQVIHPVELYGSGRQYRLACVMDTLKPAGDNIFVYALGADSDLFAFAPEKQRGIDEGWHRLHEISDNCIRKMYGSRDPQFWTSLDVKNPNSHDLIEYGAAIVDPKGEKLAVVSGHDYIHILDGKPWNVICPPEKSIAVVRRDLAKALEKSPFDRGRGVDAALDYSVGLKPLGS